VAGGPGDRLQPARAASAVAAAAIPMVVNSVVGFVMVSSVVGVFSRRP